MFYLLLIFEIILFGLVLYRLVTTNHWTIGKKLMVGLSASILIESVGMLSAMLLHVSPVFLVYVKIPMDIVGLLMVYFFYRNDLFEH